jgi:hypothetical protein
VVGGKDEIFELFAPDIFSIASLYLNIYIYPERALPYADALPDLAGPGRRPLR